MKILNDIQTQIDRLNPDDQDLVSRLEVAEKLAIMSYTLSREVGDAHAAKNLAEYKYKSSLSTYEASNEGAVAKVAAKAKDFHKELYRDMIEKENLYRQLNLLLTQVNVIIEQVRQTSSFLKKEMYEGR